MVSQSISSPTPVIIRATASPFRAGKKPLYLSAVVRQSQADTWQVTLDGGLFNVFTVVIFK